MAAKGVKRTAAVLPYNYQQLNSFSSVVMYDTTKKQRRSMFYEAERIITRRTKGKDFEYLIKWKDWPYHSCSWEPTDNLNCLLLRSYTNPIAQSNEILEEASRQFMLGVVSSLKNVSFSAVYINMHLDVWQYVTYNKGIPSAHRGHLLLNKDDLIRLKFLPENWWYILDESGEGKAVDFPIKVKPLLSWSSSSYMINKSGLCEAPRIPQERLCVTIVKRPYNGNSM